MSGLSKGVLVVEAGPDSGAMNTAEQALEQGRSVMAVPGRVDMEGARGPHSLIRNGARLVEDAHGRRFALGSGLRDADRAAPPPIGSIVTFRYDGLTAKGTPRFARFQRVRRD